MPAERDQAVAFVTAGSGDMGAAVAHKVAACHARIAIFSSIGFHRS